MASSPVKLMIAVAIAATLVAPFTTAIAGNTGTVSEVGNVSADLGNYQDVDGYNIDSATFTATDSGGTTLTESTDYELNATAGEVKFLSSGSVSDGETIELSYDYQATDGTTSTITDLLPLFVGLLILVSIAAGVTNRL